MGANFKVTEEQLENKMKFNCNVVVSEEEQNRLLQKKREALREKALLIQDKYQKKAARAREWHKKFLWLPTAISDYECRWLEFVERRYPLACGPLDRPVPDKRYGGLGMPETWKVNVNEQNDRFEISYGPRPKIEWKLPFCFGYMTIYHGEPEYRTIK